MSKEKEILDEQLNVIVEADKNIRNNVTESKNINYYKDIVNFLTTND